MGTHYGSDIRLDLIQDFRSIGLINGETVMGAHITLVRASGTHDGDVWAKVEAENGSIAYYPKTAILWLVE